MQQRILPNSKVRFTAKTLNQLTDVRQRNIANQPRMSGFPLADPPSSLIWLSNATSTDAVMGTPFAVDLLWPMQQQNSDTWLSGELVYYGQTPSASRLGKVVIAAEQIPRNQIGRAWVHGLVRCKVQLDHEAHGYADMQTGVTDRLVSASIGPVQLLWVQAPADRDPPESDTAWVLGRLSNPSVSETTFTARITEHESFVTNRWKYGWIEQVLAGDNWIDLPPVVREPRTGTLVTNYALNRREFLGDVLAPIPVNTRIQLAEVRDITLVTRYEFGETLGGGTATFDYAQIISVQNETAPYIYVCQAVTPNGDGTFGSPAGPDLNLYCLDEIGAGSIGVAKVPVGAVVLYDAVAATFGRSYYRGTYT